MEYQVSARKWRPQTFEEVVGQPHVAQTLTNAIRLQRIAHAYLFSGMRGVGKTTMARILAKAVNCGSGLTVNPCQRCASCQAITAGHSPDVIEIDGASNRGIEEVRELRETIKYTPMQGRYKVYIIDEVHMLTKEAFNALLKTLEEPPAHVIFILATTEIHKVPSTILSRCQHFQFRRMTRQEITRQLEEVAGKERLALSAGTLAILAKAADGSMRDALSLLDQAIAYGGKEVSAEDLQSMLGLPRQDIIHQVVKSLIERKPSAGLDLIQTVMDRGYDLRQFTGEVVEHIRNLLVAKLSSDPTDLMDLPKEEAEALSQMASTVTEEELQRLFGILTQALEMLRTAPHPRFILEMAVIKASQFPPLQSVEQLVERLERIEKRLSTAAASPPGTPPSRLPETKDPKPVAPDQSPKSRPSAQWPGADAPNQDAPLDSLPAENELEHPIEKVGPFQSEAHPRWEEVIGQIREEKPSLASYLEHGTLVSFSADRIQVGYPENAIFFMELVKKEEHQQIIKTVLERLFGRPVPFSLTRLERGASPPPKKPDPAKGKKIKQETLSNPLIREALDIFGGEVVDIQEP
jgi:DNA polymerase-3 subunit gamma/tau